MKQLKKLLPGLRENESLKDYTTFKIGGPAKYFFVAKNEADLIKAVDLAHTNNLPYWVLSGGSNVLIADQGYDGLVIKLENRLIKFDSPEVLVEAGVMLNKLVAECTKNNLTGLEWAAGIPGTVGGAIRGNAGAFGSEMKDSLIWVEVIRDRKNTKLNKVECQFVYRNSVFKKEKSIIIKALLKLETGDKQKIQDKVNSHINTKQETQPCKFPSAGCIFKNPEGKSAGQLIEQAGLKGKKIGDAMVSPVHANFIVNLGQAQAEQVIMLISYIKQQVRTKHQIQLQEEIEYIGFD
ncbi:UDP-N-acetylmuramate dehydrogenase [Patescibacteria group bacterium]|nr:UDP-N-acetylmuramate dehydrogenase [Patescibacteria group bacterium]